MKETFSPIKKFAKDPDDLRMLHRSIESKELDQEMIPIIEKFFTLPLTPTESCYGHPKQAKNPYLTYVEDEVTSEHDSKQQELFKKQIRSLETKINNQLGGQAVTLTMDKTDYGPGHTDHTLKFNITDTQAFQEKGPEYLETIWQEFSNYLDGLK
ncbi:MAG: hypothetical protein WCO55_06205 [Candidatus Falkowbacteria bacterium]